MAVYDEPFWRAPGPQRPGHERHGAGEGDLRQLPARRLARRAAGLPRGPRGAPPRARGRRGAPRRRRRHVRPPVRAAGRQARVDYVDRVWADEEWTRGCYGCAMPTGAWTEFGPALPRADTARFTGPAPRPGPYGAATWTAPSSPDSEQPQRHLPRSVDRIVPPHRTAGVDRKREHARHDDRCRHEARRAHGLGRGGGGAHAARGIHWCDGSAEEYDRLCQELVEAGTFEQLADAKRPNSYLALLGPGRRRPRRGPHLHLLRARGRRRPDEQLARPGRDARDARRPVPRARCRAARCTSCPFSMGPLGSPTSRHIGVQLTDSAYVAVSCGS